MALFHDYESGALDYFRRIRAALPIAGRGWDR